MRPAALGGVRDSRKPLDTTPSVALRFNHFMQSTTTDAINLWALFFRPAEGPASTGFRKGTTDMRKQHGTYPIRNNQQRSVARPVPPRAATSAKNGWGRHGVRGAR